MISVYVPCANSEEAEKISRALLEKRLIACSNMFPSTSLFWWRGKIQKEKEVVIFAKTKRENFEKIKEAVKAIHSYDIPGIVAFGVVEKDEQYYSWLKEELGR